MKPVPSICFCYDSNQCRDWYDRWLARGGSIARDTIVFSRAADMPDVRSFDDKLRWHRLECELNSVRAALRRAEFAEEIRAVKAKRSIFKVVK